MQSVYCISLQGYLIFRMQMRSNGGLAMCATRSTWESMQQTPCVRRGGQCICSPSQSLQQHVPGAIGSKLHTVLFGMHFKQKKCMLLGCACTYVARGISGRYAHMAIYLGGGGGTGCNAARSHTHTPAIRRVPGQCDVYRFTIAYWTRGCGTSSGRSCTQQPAASTGLAGPADPVFAAVCGLSRCHIPWAASGMLW